MTTLALAPTFRTYAACYLLHRHATDSDGLYVFMGEAICAFGRAIAETVHGWDAARRAQAAALLPGQLREAYRELAREALEKAVPGHGLTPAQVRIAEDNFSAIAANVIRGALDCPPGEWVLVCAKCFDTYGAEVVHGNADTFKPPVGWTCPDCGGDFMEAANA